jgi:hypothetical protein
MLTQPLLSHLNRKVTPQLICKWLSAAGRLRPQQILGTNITLVPVFSVPEANNCPIIDFLLSPE